MLVWWRGELKACDCSPTPYFYFYLQYYIPNGYLGITQCTLITLASHFSSQVYYPTMCPPLKMKKKNGTKFNFYCSFTHWSMVKLLLAIPLKIIEPFPGHPHQKSCMKSFASLSPFLRALFNSFLCWGGIREILNVSHSQYESAVYTSPPKKLPLPITTSGRMNHRLLQSLPWTSDINRGSGSNRDHGGLLRAWIQKINPSSSQISYSSEPGCSCSWSEHSWTE